MKQAGSRLRQFQKGAFYAVQENLHQRKFPTYWVLFTNIYKMYDTLAKGERTQCRVLNCVQLLMGGGEPVPQEHYQTKCIASIAKTWITSQYLHSFTFQEKL